MKNIKIIALLTLLFFCTSLSSCNSDEDNKSGPSLSTEPELTSLLPNSGYKGQKVAIIGQNLGSNKEDIKCYFDDMEIEIVDVGKNRFYVHVPEIDWDGNVKVKLSVKDKDTNILNFRNKVKYDEDEEIIKYDTEGHRIHGRSKQMTFLKRTGPFIRLHNNKILTVIEGGVNASISSDEGVTWEDFPLFDKNKYSALSPVSVQTRAGTIIVGFSNGKGISPLNWNTSTHTYDPNAKVPTYIIYSKDQGRTWSEPHKLHDDWTGMNRDIIETKSGAVVFATMKMRNNLGRHCVLTYTSKDDGLTWTASNVLDDPDCAGDHSGLMESNMVQLNDGRIWMIIRTNWDYLYETFSTDDGLTWSEYQKTDIDASSSPPVVERLSDGKLILIWNRLYQKGKDSIRRIGGDKNLSEVAASWQRDELSVMLSDNDGKTWSEPVIIAENKEPIDGAMIVDKWLSYPFVFEASPGLVWITTGHGRLKIEIRVENIK